MVFGLLVALQIFLNYDSGAISVSPLELQVCLPPALHAPYAGGFIWTYLPASRIQEVYAMDNVYAGLVTSLVYIGLVFSSLISGMHHS
jgi:hypothetical protein